MTMVQSAFSILPLRPELLANLDSLGYQSMTAIQAQSLPAILQGDDVLAQAKTGSGKTAAFGLGVLQRLQVKRFRSQALILCPTRELADQVAKELRRLARSMHNVKVLTLCGGTPLGPQIASLEHGAHIIVGTPGRVSDHLQRQRLSLDELKTFVLDEADRMLAMGFQQEINAIVAQLPKRRQTLMYSATFPAQIEQLATAYLHQPQRISVASTHDSHSIEQHYFHVAAEEKMSALVHILARFKPESTVVFCNTKKDTDTLAEKLSQAGVMAVSLHGDLEQKLRHQRLVLFANRSVPVLVATDVAARGIDIDDVSMVINYQLARDPEVHIHRIGRTGRAGQHGLAVTLVTTAEQYKLDTLQHLLKQRISLQALPPAELAAKFQPPTMRTLQINGGKKQKLRAGDILGALTGRDGIIAAQVGKINVFDNYSYVAVRAGSVEKAYKKLAEGQMKGRNFRVRYLTLSVAL